jgi:hypothetical protein
LANLNHPNPREIFQKAGGEEEVESGSRRAGAGDGVDAQTDIVAI